MQKLTLSVGDNVILDRCSGRNAREYHVRPSRSMRINHSWDGNGSRSTYRAFNADGNPVGLPSHSGALQFGGSEAEVQLDGNPVVYLVEHACFRGKYLKPVIHVHPVGYDELRKQLTSNSPALTSAQRECLRLTDGYKAGYRKNEFESWARRNEPSADYDATRTQLLEMQLLRKNNAITPAGRNALE